MDFDFISFRLNQFLPHDELAGKYSYPSTIMTISCSVHIEYALKSLHCAKIARKVNNKATFRPILKFFLYYAHLKIIYTLLKCLCDLYLFIYLFLTKLNTI